MTMLEKAARAASEIQIGVNEDGEAVFPGHHVGLALARAALLAVREPNYEIVGSAFYHATSTGVAAEQERKYTAMIDAILEGK